jgi:hypothetical protein
MPKLKKVLSAFMAIWLCVMLVTFTYTWVSRNWTPSIKSTNMSIASSGALVISLSGDDVFTEVSLNDVIGIEEKDSFVFRQVSSVDGKTFFWKDFSPTLNDLPAEFYKIDAVDTHKKDFIDARFCLTLEDGLEDSKYVFIHPETFIKCVKDTAGELSPDAAKAIRISLTYDKEVGSGAERKLVSETVILGNLEDNNDVINADQGANNTSYMAVATTAHGKQDTDPTALDYQLVYGLQYFNCGRLSFDAEAEDQSVNYNFVRDESKALFSIAPGEKKWIDMRIWLEGQDDNCIKEIAGDDFNMVLKFDSAFVQAPNSGN